MWSASVRFSARALILVLFSLSALAENPAKGDPPDLPALPRVDPLAKSSGYIFAGTVKSVERVAAKGNGVATMVINFHVDQAMRGVRAGQTLAIREWAGLWQSGERYRPGERVLLFLYPPSKLGLTSPVGGPAGRFRIDPDGKVVLSPQQTEAPARHPRMTSRFQGRTRVSPRELVRNLRYQEVE